VIKLPAMDTRGRVLDLHAMRASLATQLVELGVPDGTVSDLMRHRPVTVTQQHYVQRSHDLLRQAINLIPKEAAQVPGLWQADPREDPDSKSTGEHGCAPTNNTAAS